LIEAFLSGLAAASALEKLSVAFGLAYSLLAAMRNRWCWVAGGIGSAILVYLAARARLPMQAALQVYYVGMSFYGYWQWSRQQGAAAGQVSTWPLRFHLIALAAILVASAVSARWLAAETHAAWPFLDSATTWASLLATWLVARMKLENWLYWIVIDSVCAFLFAAQGLVFVAALFVAYLVIAVFGYLAWLRKLRQLLPSR
jgi:nicotinamide mononucleotide transporter